MRKYLVILRQSVLDSLAHGPVAFIWVIIELVEIIAPLAIWYGSTPISGLIGGYSKSQILAYYGMITIVRNLTSWYVWSPVSILVRNGDFSNLLVKPLSALKQILIGETGWKVMRTVIQIPLTVAVIVTLVLRLDSQGFSFGFPFLVSLLLGSIITLLISSCFAAVCFWITDLGGLMGLYFFMGYVLSGELAPLSIYPKWFELLSMALPLRYGISFPLELFFKRLDAQSATIGFGLGIFWLLALYWLNSYLWKKGIANYQAYGK